MTDKEKVARAMQLISAGDYVQSERLFREVIASGSELGDCFYGLGVISLNTGALDVAARHFENSIRMQPINANAHYYMGRPGAHAIPRPQLRQQRFLEAGDDRWRQVVELEQVRSSQCD